jgi:HKD family nuclease
VKTLSLKRLDLHQLLDSGSFDHAVILTYTFDPIFFEEYCLANFEVLHNCKNISVLLDRRTYDKIVTGAQTDRPKKANLRYLLHSISVPGVFHPKLVLLTSANKGHLLVGSSNFTRPGLTANAELVGSFDFKLKENETFLPILRSAFKFIQAIAKRWPTRALISNLQEMYVDSPWLEGDGQQHRDIKLMTNLENPLLTQLLSEVGGSIRCLSIVSRYFDAGTNVLEQLLNETAATKVKLYTQNRYTNLPPSWLKYSSVKSGRVELYLTDYSSDDRDQPLHGKAFAFETEKGCLFAYGSANCTTAALLRTAGNANLEDLVAVRLSSREAKVLLPRLLDPTLKAVRLLKADQLVSVPEAEDGDRGEGLSIKIKEAEADNERILVWLEQPLERCLLRAKLEFSAGRFVRIVLRETGSSQLDIDLAPETFKRLSDSSAIISIEDADGTVQSNRMLITNLMDVQTGTNVRKARYVKEAEQDTAGLLSVLNDLRSGNDEDALRTFLSFCDIPLALAPRLGLRSFKDGAPREGMRSLGQHNFILALSLHELALKFCERHFRKLGRHVSDPHPNGIPNFLHISLAIGGVLESQIDRALTGLEARNHVTPEEWSGFRTICDAYFSKYRDLTTVMWESYLPYLLNVHPSKQIRKAFEPEFEPLNDLAHRMLQFRDRVEVLRVAKCVGAGGQQSKPYGYFQSVFGQQRWQKYAGDMEATQSSIVAVIKGDAVATSSQESLGN